MRVVDTSAWIEWLKGSPLGKRVALELPANEAWIVPTIVQFELMRWGIRTKSEPQATAAIAFSNTLIVRSLDTDMATMAADVAVRNSLAMADAIVYATALDGGADLLTCDAHFSALADVVYLAKSSP